MPIVYHCEICGTSAESLDGWLFASVSILHEEPGIAWPPGGRTLDRTYRDLLFDKTECRDEWLVTAGLEHP